MKTGTCGREGPSNNVPTGDGAHPRGEPTPLRDARRLQPRVHSQQLVHCAHVHHLLLLFEKVPVRQHFGLECQQPRVLCIALRTQLRQLAQVTIVTLSALCCGFAAACLSREHLCLHACLLVKRQSMQGDFSLLVMFPTSRKSYRIPSRHCRTACGTVHHRRHSTAH